MIENDTEYCADCDEMESILYSGKCDECGRFICEVCSESSVFEDGYSVCGDCITEEILDNHT